MASGKPRNDSDNGGSPKTASLRDERRAAALRANLQRRKTQARGRADCVAEEPHSAPEQGMGWPAAAGTGTDD